MILDAGHEYVEFDSLRAVLIQRGIFVNLVPAVTEQPFIGLCITDADRPAILLPDNHKSSSRMACDLAHMAGHLCLGHLGCNDVLAETTINWKRPATTAEREANEFALTLLTGQPSLLFQANFYRDHMLIDWARRQGKRNRIAPAVVIQIYARQTGRFALANRACRAIEDTQSAHS